MIIYKAVNNINKKVYIGQTVRDLKERLKEHKRKYNSLLGKAIRKYGEENFSIETIDKAETIEELNSLEMKWIKHYDSIKPKGYNQCEGGGNTRGYNHRLESRKSMSLSKKGMYQGDKNNFFGKKHREETKEKMREAWRTKRSRTQTDNHKQKKAEAQKKKVINIDTKEVFESVKEAAEKYGLKSTHISRVCKGKRKRTGGYRWMHYEEYKAIPSQAPKAGKV